MNCSDDIKLIENNVKNFILIDQSSYNKKTQLEMKVIDKSDVVQIHVISADWVTQAQRIIVNAEKEDHTKQNKAIEKAIQLLYSYSSHEDQHNALRQLIYEWEDLILIAKISFEKSMILQTIFVLKDRFIILILLSLTQIKMKQIKYIIYIDEMFFLLNVNMISRKIFTDIQNEKYTHVLTSSELILNDKFQIIVTNSVFKKWLDLIIIDETHLISEWDRNFWTEYAWLEQLCFLFESFIFWFVCSATLNAEMLKKLKMRTDFKNDIIIIHILIDQLKLIIRIDWISKQFCWMTAFLWFIFDEEDIKFCSVSQQILKMMIFFDFKKKAYAVMKTCRKWLQEKDKNKYSQKQTMKMIKMFYYNKIKFDKETIITEFQKLNKNSSLHVIFVIKAFEMNVNLSDVQHVVLYEVSKEKKSIII